jgi:hypothetical protein
LQRPIKILVALANPANLADPYRLAAVDEAAEWALLEAATAELRDRQQVELTLLAQPCTLPALEAELKKGYHILHFVGHGVFNEAAQQASLLLADEENQVALASDQSLAEMLARQLSNLEAQRDDKLRLVVLASCQSAARSPDDAFRGLAPRLVAAGVPAVLAMQDKIQMDTAREFSRVFYGRLLAHGQVDLACNEARSALLSGGQAGAAIPALFMRLPDGQLLGQRGRITSDNEEMFWPFLLDNIDRGLCTPFLGPRLRVEALNIDTLAEALAQKYRYPLPDRRNLARVAQFVAITDPQGLQDSYLALMQENLCRYLGEALPQAENGAGGRGQSRARRSGRAEINLTQTVESLGWAEKILSRQENEIHHLLAELELPLYMTTNVDNFMVEALKYHQQQQIAAGKRKDLSVRREGLRWNPDNNTPKYVLSPEPSFEQPVVFHLNGHDGDPLQKEHLVLSEDDYLAHFARIRHDQEIVLPTNVLGMLAENSFLFLGYNLGDWEFRVVLQGLLQPIAQTSKLKKPHVGVQLDLDQVEDVDKARDYLRRYLGQYKIDIYWGTPQQFVTELHTRWRAWLAEQGG